MQQINKLKTSFIYKANLNQISVTVLPDWKLLHQILKRKFCIQLYIYIYKTLSYLQANPY